MQIYEQPDRIKTLVASWLMSKFREECHTDNHLRDCPEAKTVNPDGYDGVYGCDTGCEYTRLEVEINCSHGYSENFHYGQFGDLDTLLYDLEDYENGSE